ncbi:MAG: carbohydrate porin [Capsulimonadaceae bacterium]
MRNTLMVFQAGPLLAAIMILGVASAPALAQTASSAPASSTAMQPATTQNWNWHFQNTEIVQGDPAFPAKYSGPNSLSSEEQVQHTATLDVFAGKRLWRGAEAHVDGLLWEGFGLSQTFGIEAFPNGDAYKYGTVQPFFMFARLFIRQTIGLGGAKEDVSDDQLTLAGKQDISRLTLTAGRFSVLDVCDNNTYASDPHAQFMNWAMIGNLAWDYAADSVGFTTGLTAEYNQPKWALRYGCFLLPSIPNAFTGDDQILMWPHVGAFGPFGRDWAMNTELERRYTCNAHPGSVRFQAWLNEANMATYQAATRILEDGGPNADWQSARSFRYKYGFGLNWEQEVANNIGMFSRLGWNDGREEAWAYTDANWSGSLGVSVKGDGWRRPDDTFGLTGVVSGASTDNQKFLEAGGLGILDGDGALNYGPEEVAETYYDFQIVRGVHTALDYQVVNDPAFNRDRGPVSIFGLRLHFER